MTTKEFFVKFGKIALEVAKIQVPAISAVEAAVKSLKAGSEKKQAVVDIITAAPDIIEAIKQEDIIDQVLFKKGVGLVNDGMVAIMNSLKKPNENEAKPV